MLESAFTSLILVAGVPYVASYGFVFIGMRADIHIGVWG